MRRGHAVGLHRAVLEVGVIVEQEVALFLEELVHVLKGVAQKELVARFLEGTEESDQLFFLVLPAHVQLFLVLKEDGQVGVVPENEKKEFFSKHFFIIDK